MLAETLLQLHNTHHYLRFFAALRGAAAKGPLAFARFRAAIEAQLER